MHFCRKKGCGCGKPVLFRMIGGRRIALHIDEYIDRLISG